MPSYCVKPINRFKVRVSIKVTEIKKPINIVGLERAERVVRFLLKKECIRVRQRDIRPNTQHQHLTSRDFDISRAWNIRSVIPQSCKIS